MNHFIDERIKNIKAHYRVKDQLFNAIILNRVFAAHRIACIGVDNYTMTNASGRRRELHDIIYQDVKALAEDFQNGYLDDADIADAIFDQIADHQIRESFFANLKMEETHEIFDVIIDAEKKARKKVQDECIFVEAAE